MSNVSRDMKLQGKQRYARDQKHYNRNENAFEEIISRLDLHEERTFDLEDVSIESSKAEKQREQRLKNKTEKNIQGQWDHYKRYTF